MKAMMVALAFAAVACGAPAEQEGPKLYTIHAGNCAVLTSSDGEEIQIGTEPDNMAPGGYRAAYSVSFEFSFYAEHARLCQKPEEPTRLCDCDRSAE